TLQPLIATDQQTFDVVDLYFDLLRLQQHELSVGRELQSVRCAIEHHRTETFLEMIEPPRDGRVVNAESSRRCANRSAVRDRGENLQIVPIHARHRDL